jgi:hypothetical protein
LASSSSTPAARGKGVKPIAGADVWIANPDAPEDAYRLLLLARNRTGYQQLCELLTKAYLVEGRRDRAEIRREWFAEIGSDGLIALSGGISAMSARRCSTAISTWPASAPKPGRRFSPAPSISKCSATGSRSRKRSSSRRPTWLANSACRWSPRIRSSS